jgi:putative ABC transport system substrate-binding protein
MRRIGVLTNLAAEDPQAPVRLAGFLQGLQQSGWIVGQNVRIDFRWGAGDPDRIHKYAAELIALKPDVVLASGTTIVGALLRASRSVPIVFVGITDPVGGGFVQSLASPGGNATGFILFEYAIGAKWLELLKEIAPEVRRAVVLRNPAITSGVGQFGALQSVGPLLGLELSPVNIGDVAEIERALAVVARQPNSGLIVTAGGLATVRREEIIKLASHHRIPGVYYQRLFVESGGLVSYGPDFVVQYRQAAGYVDRILKGEKPANLPVLAPAKYELVVNLKTAKSLGLTVTPSLLARADEVIE